MDTKFSDYFSVKLMWSRVPHLVKKIPITLELAGLAFLVSIIIGLLIAIIRYKKVKILSPIASAFLSLMRGTPMLIQLYVAYYGIPAILRIFNSWGADIDVNIIPKMVYAFVALGLYQAAFTSEIFRAALESVDKGEIEAATAMGMTYPQILRRIIVPEALENALPGICNSVIGLVKGTSLASTCGIIEITYQNSILAGRDYRYLEGYVALAIIYWVITVILEKIFKLIEKRFRIPEQPKAVEAAKEV
ncbi:MAG: amino acid ABC transporter permease [Lachnospiraceae bacterium]|jgi:amine acid ABC transporter, permease protein, 3-TM region, His/Glu/Gln/Arg/opine family|nr:amino acid ABC transporter permease [Lachnospiraceae bacterium]